MNKVDNSWRLFLTKDWDTTVEYTIFWLCLKNENQDIIIDSSQRFHDICNYRFTWTTAFSPSTSRTCPRLVVPSPKRILTISWNFGPWYSKSALDLVIPYRSRTSSLREHSTVLPVDQVLCTPSTQIRRHIQVWLVIHTI